MSVQIIQGNLLDWPNGANLILHGCNTLGGVFGAGVAKQIAERYPLALQADIDAAAEGANRLGLFSVAKIDDKRIVNVYIQDQIGTDSRKVNYEAVYTALETLRDSLENAAKEGRKYTVAMPWIGCGLAGGSRRIIEAMVRELFDKSQITVYIVEYSK